MRLAVTSANGFVGRAVAQHLARCRFRARSGEKRMSLTPLRRTVGPAEIAANALFLASDASSFITGQTIVADGGTTITDGS